jgi:hypothetical protein
VTRRETKENPQVIEDRHAISDETLRGTSRSGFRAEVESEQALRRGEHLTDIATTYHHDLAGPAAQEARRRLDILTSNPDFPGLVLADPLRTRRFLARHDPDIYPGTYATCVFTAATARCLPPSEAATSTGPTLEQCHPLECVNVALTPDNAAALQREHNRLENALTSPASLRRDGDAGVFDDDDITPRRVRLLPPMAARRCTQLQTRRAYDIGPAGTAPRSPKPSGYWTGPLRFGTSGPYLLQAGGPRGLPPAARRPRRRLA